MKVKPTPDLLGHAPGHFTANKVYEAGVFAEVKTDRNRDEIKSEYRFIVFDDQGYWTAWHPANFVPAE